jgi:hypothetical protein
MNQTEKIKIAIIACISFASEIGNISEKFLLILECNIDSDDENIRIISFRGLRAAIEKGYKSEVFTEWCNNIFTNL